MTSGKYIRKWRTNLHLTYEQVAEGLEVSPMTVRNWEKQKTLKQIVRLAFNKVFVDVKPKTRFQKLARRPHIPGACNPRCYACRQR